MCNKSIICDVLFASGAITIYEGNNMFSVVAKYVINRLIHGLKPSEPISRSRADSKGNMKKAMY